MDRPDRRDGERGLLVVVACVVLGLALGAVVGFLVGLLRPQATSGYTPAYVPPPAADDATVSVEPPVLPGR